LIVAAAHCGFGAIVPGGLGVTIFFFLSGYLISTLMLDEYQSHGTLNIGHFYLRRILRLYPPLLVMLMIAYALVHFRLLGGGFSVGGLFSQLFYFANYDQLFLGNRIPDGTGILWSLAVEEHFYLVYPIMFLALVRANARTTAVLVLGLLSLLALLWRMYLASRPGFETSRTYYATDTRFDSILFGCILAFFRRDSRHVRTTERMRLSDYALFLAGIGGLVASLLFRGQFFRETVRYSIQGISLLPIFSYCVTRPGNPLFLALNARPIKRIGVYSYSIYLIHFVILSLIWEHAKSLTAPGLVLAVTLAIAVGYSFLIDSYVDPYFKSLRKRLH
jgi:peptidoglycan/LPS O-acetylase OafA/YrhL